jgi:hypothetical protein
VAFFVCPPEGGLGSSWLKHALKQRSPITLTGLVRAVVVIVLERVFVVGGEVVAATTSVAFFIGALRVFCAVLSPAAPRYLYLTSFTYACVTCLGLVLFKSARSASSLIFDSGLSLYSTAEVTFSSISSRVPSRGGFLTQAPFIYVALLAL